MYRKTGVAAEKREYIRRLRKGLMPVLLAIGMSPLCACGTAGTFGSGLTAETMTAPVSPTSSGSTENREDQGTQEQTEPAAESAEDKDASETGEGITITMLDVGQGLSLLVEADGHSLIYDGGGREASSYVVNSLQRRNISSLDYMIASHYDEDHIAGLIGCLYRFDTDTVLCPDYSVDTDIYQSFERALTNSSAQVIHPSQGDTFELGSAEITVIGPEAYDSSEDNNNSVAVRIVYGDFTCVFTGDAESKEEKKIAEWAERYAESDLLVAGHHGSQYSTSEDFLKAVAPKVVWISCGLGNDYGHPAEETMDRLKEYGAVIYRTDLQGEITCSSDGKSIVYSQDACEDYSDGAKAEETSSAAAVDRNNMTDSGTEDTAGRADGSTADSGEGETAGGTESSGIQKYILNTSSMKFHLPDCTAVGKMSSHNKLEVEADREELIAEGYEPCGICNP